MTVAGALVVAACAGLVAYRSAPRLVTVRGRGDWAAVPAPDDARLFGIRVGLAGALTSAVAAAAVPAPVLPAAVAATSACLLAAVVDVRVRRLPNVMVLPATGVVVVLLVGAERWSASSGSLTRCLVAYVLTVTALTVGSLARPTAMGMGDTRFLGLALLVPAYLHPAGVALLLLSTLVAVAVVGAWWRSARGPRTVLPLGPPICLALVAVQVALTRS